MQVRSNRSRLISTVLSTVAVLSLLGSPRALAKAAASGNATVVAASSGGDIADELGDQAVATNPGVGAIESRIGALREQVDRSGAWLDPTFSAEYSNMPIDSLVPGHHPMSGIQLTLRQTLYWPGKIEARKEEAKSRVREEQLTLAEKKVQLRALVRRAYYRLALTRQLRSVTQEHLKLVGDFLDVVRVKNEAGIAAQHEFLRLRVLLEQLKDDLENYDRDERSLTATINATLHRSLDVPVLTPEQTKVQAPVADVHSLTVRVERERPLLKRYQAEASVYRAAARRAAREGYPDITVFAGYRVRTSAGGDPGTDFVSLGFSVPLPLSYDGRYGTEERQNEKMALAAVKERAAELDSMRGDLGRIMATWRRSVKEAQTYREQLTPQARLTLDATFASYQVGRADFASLFQAELELLDFERTTRMAETSAAEARVDAEAIVGSGVK